MRSDLARDVDQEVTDVAFRWNLHWRDMQQVTDPLTPHARLVAALVLFLKVEYEGVSASEVLEDITFAGIANAGTHSAPALARGRHALSEVQSTPRFWTRKRRLAAAALALWWLGVTLWEVLRVHAAYYERVQAVDLAWTLPLFIAAIYGAFAWVRKD